MIIFEILIDQMINNAIKNKVTVRL